MIYVSPIIQNGIMYEYISDSLYLIKNNAFIPNDNERDTRNCSRLKLLRSNLSVINRAVLIILVIIKSINPIFLNKPSYYI